MKKYPSLMLLGTQLISTATKSQSLPVMADTAIHISLLMEGAMVTLMQKTVSLIII